MKYFVFVVFAVLLAGCGPVEPTGNVISSATNAGDVLITYDVYSDDSPSPVRITLRGDVVSENVFIDDQQYVLSGREARDGWLSDKGTMVVSLEKGRYRVVGVSCVEDVFSVDCTRIGRTIRV